MGGAGWRLAGRLPLSVPPHAHPYPQRVEWSELEQWIGLVRALRPRFISGLAEAAPAQWVPNEEKEVLRELLSTIEAKRADLRLDVVRAVASRYCPFWLSSAIGDECQRSAAA